MNEAQAAKRTAQIERQQELADVRRQLLYLNENFHAQKKQVDALCRWASNIDPLNFGVDSAPARPVIPPDQRMGA